MAQVTTNAEVVMVGLNAPVGKPAVTSLQETVVIAVDPTSHAQVNTQAKTVLITIPTVPPTPTNVVTSVSEVVMVGLNPPLGKPTVRTVQETIVVGVGVPSATARIKTQAKTVLVAMPPEYVENFRTTVSIIYR